MIPKELAELILSKSAKESHTQWGAEVSSYCLTRAHCVRESALCLPNAVFSDIVLVA